MKTIINGSEIAFTENQLETRLLDFLRENLDLTGTKSSCEAGVCGSCTVLVDDRAELACRMTMREVIGKRVVTIEGFTPKNGLHPLQQAFLDHGAFQCGFCTPGMILAAHAFLLNNSHPTREEIRRAINGNLCRCTGYLQIVNAIEAAAAHYRNPTGSA